MFLATKSRATARAGLRSASHPRNQQSRLCSLIGSTLLGASAMLACSSGAGADPGGLGAGGSTRAGTIPGVASGGASAGAPTGAATAVPTNTAASPTPTGTAPPPAMTTPVPTGTATPAPTGTTPPAPTGTVAPPAPTGTTMPAPTSTVAPPGPPPGTTEFTLSTTPFTLNPGEEAFKCQEMPNTTGKDIAIVQASATMSKGSHHMFVFYDAMFNQTQALSDCTGTEFHNFLILTQSPEETQTYPAGVGRLLKSTEGFRFGMHYLNTTTDPIMANVTARFDYKDASAVQHLAAQMELNNGRLQVPPGQSTASLSFRIPYDISLIYAISHMHKQAVHFKATAAGQTLYETTVWDEPVPKTYDPALSIPGNSTLTWACDYKNPTSNTLTFGESAQTNEMCIFFGVFYATQASSPQGQGLNQLF